MVLTVPVNCNYPLPSIQVPSFNNAAVRGRVPQLPQPQCDGFIHNGIHFGGTQFRLKPSTRLSEIAYQHRQAILTALDPEDIEAGLAVQREKARCGQDTLICEPLNKITVMVSWTGAWRGLDFSGAVKAPKKGETPAQDLQPLVLGQSIERNTPMRCELAFRILTEAEQTANGFLKSSKTSCVRQKMGIGLISTGRCRRWHR